MESIMRAACRIVLMTLSISAIPAVAAAGTLEGAGIGAGTGALVAGPVGAVVGGVVGAAVGGPNIITGRHHYGHAYRHCWHDRRGNLYCSRH